MVLAGHQMHQHAYDCDTTALNATYLAARAALPKNSAARRILRYNQAKCLCQAGRYTQADTIALNRNRHGPGRGLQESDVVGQASSSGSARLEAAQPDLDDCKRLADCLALTRLPTSGTSTSGSAWPLCTPWKSLPTGQAWRHFVAIGQDIADDFVELGDLQQAMELLDKADVAAQQQGTGDRLLAVRAQRAVVLAHAGDFTAALTEIESLLRYNVPPSQTQEINKQKDLVEQLARMSSSRPGRPGSL